MNDSFSAPGEQPEIRRLAPRDLDKLVYLELAAFAYPWSRRHFADSLSNGHDCFGLWLGDTLVGHYILQVVAGDATIMNIAVHPACQGRGLGRLLLGHLLDNASRQHADMVFLEVRPSNSAAIALYENIGFAEVGRRPNYYDSPNGREDAIIMCFDMVLLSSPDEE